MSHQNLPKYAIPEIERRWLVDREATGDLSALAYFDIDDLYIEGSRLRLRRMAGSDGHVALKLCKKYGGRSDLSEPITNLYLSKVEFALLAGLPGRRSSKRRYRLVGGSLDVYTAPRAGLCIFERELADELSARAYQPPGFVTREITGDSEYSGATLAAVPD